MVDWISSPRSRWLIAAIILVAAIAAWVWLQGSAVVIDDTGQVATAVITDGANPPAETPLHRLWNGHFYGIPSFEGTIEVRCRNGTRSQWGYVIRGLHTRVRVVGQSSCQRALVDERPTPAWERY